MDDLILRRPDDMHLHLRDHPDMPGFLGATARQFGRAIVMPNLKTPVTTVAEAKEYRARINQISTMNGYDFTPLMTLYLTDNTEPDLLWSVFDDADDRVIHGVKLYPAGATTNSDAGVTNINKVAEVFAVMQKVGVPLLVHGEVTGEKFDIFDREFQFLELVLLPIIQNFPELQIVLEHITTADAVKFVKAFAGAKVENGIQRISATITAHHLLENRNAIFRGGLNPHNYCLPVLKRETDRQALLKAATSGSPQFFAGTDSAPHTVGAKETACGCAGCFTAPVALELYATAFEQVGKLDRLNDFLSKHGAAFYGLEPNEGTVTLKRQDWKVPEEFLGENTVYRPFWAGHDLKWKLEG